MAENKNPGNLGGQSGKTNQDRNQNISSNKGGRSDSSDQDLNRTGSSRSSDSSGSSRSDKGNMNKETREKR